MKLKNINKTIVDLALTVLFFVVAFVPTLTFAQGGFIPCDRDCGYYDLIKLVNNVINWVIIIAVPVAAGVIAWAGLTIMLSGENPGKRSDGLKMIRQVLTGLVFILAAWLIVSTVLNALLSSQFPQNAIQVQIN